MKVKEKFLRYAATDTASEPDSPETPSTDKQRVFAEMLCDELRGMGAEDVKISDNAYVYARIPSNVKRDIPKIGFIAHLDTAPAVSGTGVKPRVFENYDGGTLEIGNGVSIRPEEFCHLSNYIGQDIITSSGDTLLGADDKAGIAEILTAVEELLAEGGAHASLRIGFTPDEEIGRGADRFDLAHFGADYAYTVDGGTLGELEYENFNAASAVVTVHGRNVHPGSAKRCMINAQLIAMEFHGMLPVHDRPEATEGYEGFSHLCAMQGEVELATLEYIIRDHDRASFEARKALFESAAAFLNAKYGAGTVEVALRDSYYNMREKIEPHMAIVEAAQQAMRDAGVTPRVVPIRGGTDGARLSYEGLPCPNLFTGGENYHGRFEYVPVEDMEAAVRTLKCILRNAAK